MPKQRSGHAISERMSNRIWIVRTIRLIVAAFDRGRQPEPARRTVGAGFVDFLNAKAPRPPGRQVSSQAGPEGLLNTESQRHIGSGRAPALRSFRFIEFATSLRAFRSLAPLRYMFVQVGV
jgi:hypothetical protein